jgi:N-carbamoylputrescine amidase
MSRITVAAAQTGPVLTDDAEAGLPRARALFDEASARGVDILCFSEVFLAPFFPNRLDRDFGKWFLEPTGAVVTALRDKARSAGIAAIIPFAERAPVGFFNSAMVVDKRGEVVGTYRKTHIPAYFPTGEQGGTGSYEKLYFAPGADLPVFAVAGVRLGIQICNDRLYPEGSRTLALKGAEILFMPICYSTYSDPKHRAGIWPVPLRARAYENGAFVVAANRVGPEGERRHLGRSMIVDPRGAVIAEAGDEKEELLVATLDLGEVATARRDFPWWRDRRPDLYTPIVSGLAGDLGG